MLPAAVVVLRIALAVTVAGSSRLALLARLRAVRRDVAELAAVVALLDAALDPRDPRRRKLKVRDIEFFYGHRGVHPAVRYASAHEFVRCWEVVLARYPRTLEEGAVPSSRFHATLTEAGRRRPQEAKEENTARPELRPGVDYEVREDPTAAEGWLPFPSTGRAAALCHTWVMCRRLPPLVPDFGGCPWPRHGAAEAERWAREEAVETARARMAAVAVCTVAAATATAAASADRWPGWRVAHAERARVAARARSPGC